MSDVTLKEELHIAEKITNVPNLRNIKRIWKQKLDQHHRQYNSTYHSTDLFDRFIRPIYSTYHLTDSFDISFNRLIRFIRPTTRPNVQRLIKEYIYTILTTPCPKNYSVYIYIIYSIILRVRLNEPRRPQSIRIYK
jgi:hypothetical protein